MRIHAVMLPPSEAPNPDHGTELGPGTVVNKNRGSDIMTNTMNNYKHYSH